MRQWIPALLCVLVVSTVARADWPKRVFAPYLYLGSGDGLQMTSCDDACEVKYYTLAFIIARQEGRGNDARYLREPSWVGRVPMGENLYADQIEAIRRRGGDVIISFGGQAGRELAIVEEDSEALEKVYQSIIDRYHFTWLDFDIEGSNLEKNPQANERRNGVLARLQKKNPGLVISFTLPVDPDGITHASQKLLADAKAKGVRVHSANLMVMYFGKRFINKGKSEGELAIDSAKAAYAQVQKIDPTIQIGLCPCLGRNGSNEEVFTVDDAKTLKAFADEMPWGCSLHFWSINGDAKGKGADGKAWAFAKVFNSFTH